MGYAIDDLDDNGIPDLVIGTIFGDDFFGKLVFDLYTVGKNEEGAGSGFAACANFNSLGDPRTRPRKNIR